MCGSARRYPCVIAEALIIIAKYSNARSFVARLQITTPASTSAGLVSKWAQINVRIKSTCFFVWRCCGFYFGYVNRETNAENIFNWGWPQNYAQSKLFAPRWTYQRISEHFILWTLTPNNHVADDCKGLQGASVPVAGQILKFPKIYIVYILCLPKILFLLNVSFLLLQLHILAIIVNTNYHSK